jgi:hypothetical protein
MLENYFRNRPQLDIIIDIGSIITLIVLAFLFVLERFFPGLPVDPQFLVAIITVLVYIVRWLIRRSTATDKTVS